MGYEHRLTWKALKDIIENLSEEQLNNPVYLVHINRPSEWDTIDTVGISSLKENPMEIGQPYLEIWDF